MEKNYVFTGSLSSSKRTALLLALAKYHNLQHMELSQIKPLDVTPLSAAKTMRASERQADRITKKFEGFQKGDIVIGIQKGIDLGSKLDVPALLVSVSANKITEVGACIQISTFSVFSEEIILPQEISTLVRAGTPLYEAYGKILGEEVGNNTISAVEYLTGEKEELWLARAINNLLLPLFGPHKHLFNF